MCFGAVRSADLDKPGAFQTVQVGRESVLITRSRSGEVRAFFNVCRHRGARLCTEESGEVKRAFQCGYHAWTYDLDAKLAAAPNLTRRPDIDRVEQYDAAHLRAGRRIRYDVEANWKLIIENFMECYHCATIHPELTEVLPEFADGLAVQYHVGHGAEFGEQS